jgi:hypothetical protein
LTYCVASVWSAVELPVVTPTPSAVYALCS